MHIFDIETGPDVPRAMAVLPEFDENDVAVGNLKLKTRRRLQIRSPIARGHGLGKGFMVGVTEVKPDHPWHVTRKVYIELQALEASQADKYLIFAGKLPCRVRFKNGFRLA